MISVGPVYTGYSSPEEIRTYLANANSSRVLDECKLADSLDEDEKDFPVRLENSAVEFAPTYPSKSSYSTVTLHNFRYSDATHFLCVHILDFTVSIYGPPEVGLEGEFPRKQTLVMEMGTSLTLPCRLGTKLW